MKTEEVKSIKIELEGDEADRFKSAIKKIDKENGAIGFKNPSNLDADEIKLLREINEKVNK